MSKEVELLYLVINAVFGEGLSVWNCRYEECPDHIIVDGIPFRLKVGDFVYRGKDRFYAVELKFITLRHVQIHDRRLKKKYWSIRRRTFKLYRTQFELIKNNGGFLVMVFEPSRSKEERESIGKLLNEETCKSQLQTLRQWMGENKRQYDCAILGRTGIVNVLKKKEFVPVNDQWDANVERVSLNFGKVWKNALHNFSSYLKDLPSEIAKKLPH